MSADPSATFTPNIEDEKKQMQHKIVSNLNEQVKNVANEYNIQNDLYNDKQKILNKYDFYISLQNEKLQTQLDKLQKIEDTVSTKTSLVRHNQNSYNEKLKTISSLHAFFIFGGLIMFCLIAFLGGKISLPVFMSISVISIMLYIIYYFYINDIFFFKSIPQDIHFKTKEIGKGVVSEADQLRYDINKSLNKHCDCPDEAPNRDEGDEPLGPSGEKARLQPTNQGFHYYDGSAPPQRIMPETKSSGKNGYRIDWNVAPDYGSRQNVRFTPGPTYLPDRDNGDEIPTEAKDNEYGLPRSEFTGSDSACEGRRNVVTAMNKEPKEYNYNELSYDQSFVMDL